MTPIDVVQLILTVVDELCGLLGCPSRKIYPLARDLPLVAHVIDSLDISGGAEKQLIANLRSFNHEAMTHELIVLRRSSTSRLAEVPRAVSVLEIFDFGDAPSRGSVMRRLIALARDRRYDLIHASLPTAALGARAVGFATDTRVVESLVNISHESVRCVDNPSVTPLKLALHTQLDKVTMKSLAGLHAVSHAVATSWVKTVGLDPDKITVIPRGVDHQILGRSSSDEDQRAEVRESLRVSEGEVLVLSVGRLEPQKGHRYLVEAIAGARRPELRAVIAGRHGNSSASIEELISIHGLDDRVRLIGPRSDVPALLRAADIFAFPSLFEGNGGNAMIEAMAAGLPVVTTNEPPMTDLIPDERHGLLTARADPDGLADALRRLCLDPELRRTLGAAAKARASTFPSHQDVASRFEDWYGLMLET